MTSVELAWLAGLLEGEGCFSALKPKPSALKKRPNAKRTPDVRVSMQDLDIMERVAALMGGRPIHRMKARNWARRDSYKVQLQGQAALELMRALRPFMGKRRTAKIDEILAIFE